MSHIEKYLLQITLLLIVFCLPAQPGAAQVSVSASADKAMVGEDELVELQFLVENVSHVQQFLPPSFRGCKVIEGPLQSSGIFVGDGIANQYVSFKYVIRPNAPGSYKLSGASVTINNQRFGFNSIRFMVEAPPGGNDRHSFSQYTVGGDSGQELYSDYVLRKGEDIQTKVRQNLFIGVDVSKNHCYEGEAVVATYKLYSRLCSESKVSQRPSFMGFSVFDVVDPATASPTVEYWNGRLFTVYLIRKVQLFPLHPGILNLDPAVVDNSITFLTAEAARNETAEHLPELLRTFESKSASYNDMVSENVRISSKPLSVTVMPLPHTSRPASFDGAVGNFSIETSIDKAEVRLDDVAVVKVMVKGEGNFNMINAPRIHWPKQIEAFQPEIAVNVLRSEVPMRGYKTFAFTVVPKQSGTLIIPPVVFSYFDPQSGTYKTVQSEALQVHATAAIQPQASGAVLLTPESEHSRKANAGWWMISLVLVLGLSGYFVYRNLSLGRRFNRSSNRSSKVQNKTDGAQPTVMQSGFTASPLFRARLLLVQQNGKGFYAELDKVLRRELGRKLQLTAGITGYNAIIQRMKESGIDDIVISQFELLIQQCEIALYTPVFNEAEMQSVFDLAEDLLDSVSCL